MKKILTAAMIGAFAFTTATPVFAMDATPKTPVDTMQKAPAASPEQTGAINRVMLESGENSFTEGQAKARIEKAGFTNVGMMKMDDKGIWRASANKGATTVNVGLDFKGNVAADGASAQ